MIGCILAHLAVSSLRNWLTSCLLTNKHNLRTVLLMMKNLDLLILFLSINHLHSYD